MSIRAQEVETYTNIWAVESYAAWSPGAEHVRIFEQMTAAKPGDRVLDAGCGAGKGALALENAGFDVHMCDLTDEGLDSSLVFPQFTQVCLWDRLVGVVPQSDWVYCADVMEHIPTPMAMLVVARLLEISRKGVFLTIALQQDSFGVWVGKKLHRTVESFVWWRDHLAEVAEVVECRDMLNVGAYLIRAK